MHSSIAQGNGTARAVHDNDCMSLMKSMRKLRDVSDSGHTRRDFLLAAGAALVSALPSQRAWAQRAEARTLRIGVVGSPSHTRAQSKTLLQGVALGIEEATRTAAMFGHTVVAEYFSIEELEARAHARPAKDPTHPAAVLGGSDADECARIASAASQIGALYLNAGCSADRLRSMLCASASFHIASSDAMRLDASLYTLRSLTANAARSRWLLVADSSPTAQLVERVKRHTGNTVEVESVTMSDLQSAPIDRSTSGSDAIILATTATPAAQVFRLLDQRPHPFVVDARPSASRLMPALTGTLLTPTEWHSSLERFGAAQLSARYAARFNGDDMDGDAWSGWMAVKVLIEAVLRASTTDAASLAAFLVADRTRFDGHKGTPLSFRRWDRQLRQPMYVVRSHRATGGSTLTLSVIEHPGTRSSDTDVEDLLDQFGDTAERHSCSKTSR